MTCGLVILIYVVKDKDIWSKKLNIHFEEDFKNPVDLSLSKLEARPGEEIDVNMKTNPKSFVGLLGIDKSLLLLKSGNDLDRDQILKLMVGNFSKIHPNHQRHRDHLNYWTDFKVSERELMESLSLSTHVEYVV